MRKLAGHLIGTLVGGLCLNISSMAQTVDRGALAFSAGIQHTYDSNFLRTPEEVEEQITRASAGVQFNKQISAQKVALSINGSQYRYNERDELDSSAIEGKASWRSQFTSNFSSQLDFQRDEAPVDKLEFIGKDLVAREDASARISLGDNRRFGLILGIHQVDNTHSNDDRSGLDFQDQDFFSEVRYRFSSSWVGLRYREGDRSYELLNPILGDLDFDYRQLELETEWSLTPKTKLTGFVGYFDRAAKSEGTNGNDGEGSLASLALEWAITDKLISEITYRYNQPAIGETADAPSEVSDTVLLIQWRFSPKVQIGFGGSYATLNYEESAVITERTEHNITVTPLLVSWSYSEALMLRLTSQWTDRRSPIYMRDYDGYSAGLALAFHF
jgi:hypothetical protein